MIVRADLHVHTDASPDGISNIREQACAARRAGLHAIAVTDHNLCTNAPGVLEDVLIIPGCEVSTTQGHVTGIFLSSPLDLASLRAKGLPSGAEATAEIRRCGGIAVLAHPYESPSRDPDASPFPLDAIESINARACFHVLDANERAASLSKRRGLPATGGSDGHSAAEVGNAYTEIEADALTSLALREAILAGRTKPVLKRATPRFRKGLSQFKKARREGGAANIFRGMLYIGYCVALSAVDKVKGVFGNALQHKMPKE